MDDIREKLGALSAKVDAAHSRIDKTETQVREDLKEIFKELKTLNENMNKGKGSLATILFFAGGSGVGAGLFAQKLFSLFGKQ